MARPGRPDAVVLSHPRGKVADHQKSAFSFGRITQEGQYALILVITIDPFEAIRIKFLGMEGWLGPVKRIEIPHPAPQALMRRPLEQIPIQAGIVVPFPPLAEFSSHKEQFLPWLHVLIAEEQAQVGKLLPPVSGHLANERSFAVNHLVMRKGQNEIFSVGVKRPKGEFRMMKTAVDGVPAKVSQAVM